MNETLIFPTLEAVKEARKSIENVVNYTPLQYNARLSEKFGANIFLKREDLQPVRSYKLRGAYNKIKTLFIFSPFYLIVYMPRFWESYFYMFIFY